MLSINGDAYFSTMYLVLEADVNLYQYQLAQGMLAGNWGSAIEHSGEMIYPGFTAKGTMDLGGVYTGNAKFYVPKSDPSAFDGHGQRQEIGR